jgi:hypothetical protein
LYSYIKPGIASTKFFQTFDINDEQLVLPEDIVNLACDPIVTPASTPVRKKNASINVVSDELKNTVRTSIATGISVFSLYLQVDYTSYIIILSQGKRINQNETSNSEKKQKK